MVLQSWSREMEFQMKEITMNYCEFFIWHSISRFSDCIPGRSSPALNASFIARFTQVDCAKILDQFEIDLQYLYYKSIRIFIDKKTEVINHRQNKEIVTRFPGNPIGYVAVICMSVFSKDLRPIAIYNCQLILTGFSANFYLIFTEITQS